MTSAENRAAFVRISDLEVDGVMTDGLICPSSSGDKLKAFNTKNRLGRKLFQKAGVKVAIITARQSGMAARTEREPGVEEVGVRLIPYRFTRFLPKTNVECSYAQSWP